MNSRREFLALSGAACFAQSADTPKWKSKVIDIHLHWRQDLRMEKNANLVHMDGCGVDKAVLLTRAAAADAAAAVVTQYPGKFVWSVSADITKPDSEQMLTAAVKKGAKAFGELKFHVAADSPELRRAYSLAADLDVPILIHFQEVDHFEGEGKWATGFKNFAAMLKAHPKTRFIGHADAFWANVSADYHEEAAYPTGPIKKGGVTDKLLADFENMYGDLSANSGNNAMSRDPEFTAGFLKRHQNKLMFGSDCACADGKGSGVSQQRNPTASRMSGKCVARETLTVLNKHLDGAALTKVTWGNAHKLYKIT
jgi:predicted TIM-barrel fold metal-dependent hydrolase